MTSDNRFDLAKFELDLTQKQVDKYDDLSAKIKTWAITLWAALLGWSFQAGQKNFLLLAASITFFLWILDAVNKNFRQDYRTRRDKVALALKTFFQNSSWPENFFSPDLPSHKLRGAVGQFFELHIFLPYVSLIVAALVIFLI